MKKNKAIRIAYVCSIVFLFIMLTYAFLNDEQIENKYCRPCLSKLQSELSKTEQITIGDLNNVAKFCKSSNKIDEVYCVNNYIQRNYKPVLSGLPYPKEPLKTLNEGGDCDDWNWGVYLDIFDRMGGYSYNLRESNFTSEIGVIEMRHGYLEVKWTENNAYVYCIIDQGNIVGCNSLGGVNG